jgi:choline dehydrogenase-like flavoprotein
LTVAGRLSEDPQVSVAVIEAGPNAEGLPEVRSAFAPINICSCRSRGQVFIPGLAGTGQASTNLDWKYSTTPQTNLNGRRVTVKAGKALGGSTVINSMIFVC